jgi:hypothetical protein
VGADLCMRVGSRKVIVLDRLGSCRQSGVRSAMKSCSEDEMSIFGVCKAARVVGCGWEGEACKG